MSKTRQRWNDHDRKILEGLVTANLSALKRGQGVSVGKVVRENWSKLEDTLERGKEEMNQRSVGQQIYKIMTDRGISRSSGVGSHGDEDEDEAEANGSTVEDRVRKSRRRESVAGKKGKRKATNQEVPESEESSDQEEEESSEEDPLVGDEDEKIIDFILKRKHDFDELRAEMEGLKSKLKRVKQKLSEQTSSLQTKVDKLTSKKMELRQKIASLQAKLQRRTERKDVTIAELQKESADLRTQLEELTETSERKRKARSKKVKRLEANIAEQEKSETGLTNLLDLAKRDAENKDTQLKAYEEEILGLKQELLEAQHQVVVQGEETSDELNRIRKELETREAALRNESENLRQEVVRLNNARRLDDDSYQTLKRQLSVAETEVDDLFKQLHESNAEREELQSQLSSVPKPFYSRTREESKRLGPAPVDLDSDVDQLEDNKTLKQKKIKRENGA